MAHFRVPVVLLLLTLLSLAPGFAQSLPATGAAAPVPADGPRPRIGLVLSGGGARGLAHVGVLKVLEDAHVPVDVIAGTSMGAIIGGLYASGMKATDIERELNQVDWDRLFSRRVGRQQLSQRRKEEDFEIATAVELGIHDGEFRAPQGAVSSRGLETLLRQYTLPVGAVQDFDQLPIRFRAVATDMETGQPVVLASGDLAAALRSSMSVPGVFPATEVDGRVLGDGGLVDNLPIGVARSMGADVVIVVNIGTPLAKRDTLGSAFGLTTQMINILTEQNVQRSLASLLKSDLLIAPDLGTLTSADFARTRDFIALGQASAQRHAAQLAQLALPAADYAAWRAARHAEPVPGGVLAEVSFEGTTVSNPARFQAQLKSRPGQAFDPQKAADDAQALAATGDYLRTDYRLTSGPEGPALVFDLEDKPWGPHYLRIGLDLSTDFSGRSAFDIKISHNRHWLTPNGTEWRNRVQIGEVPLVYTELYHPLNWTLGVSNDWFVSAYGGAERRTVWLYDGNGGSKAGELRRTTGRLGLDLGQPWGSLGELRLGLVQQVVRAAPLLLSASYPGPQGSEYWRETVARAHVVFDQLDFANFPQSGWRLEAEGQLGQRTVRGTAGSQRLARLESRATTAVSLGAHTFSLSGQVQIASARNQALRGEYTLGGFQQLSGYEAGQVAGNATLFGRLGWYRRLAGAPVFARGLFVGGSLEAGNAWATRREMRLSGLRTGASLYLGADTGIGPMYLGATWAPEGQAGMVLFIGRP